MDVVKLTLSEPESDYERDHFISSMAGDKIGDIVKELVDDTFFNPKLKIISIHAERWVLKEGGSEVWCDVLNRVCPPHELFDCVDTWDTECAYRNLKNLRLWMD